MKQLGPDSVLFYPRRLHKSDENDQSLPDIRTEQALSSVLPTVPPADISPGLSKIESPAALYSGAANAAQRPGHQTFMIQTKPTAPSVEEEGGAATGAGHRVKHRSGILSTIESKEHLGGGQLKDVLTNSHESILSLIRKEHLKGVNKENIRVEQAEMFQAAQSRKESRSTSPHRSSTSAKENKVSA